MTSGFQEIFRCVAGTWILGIFCLLKRLKTINQYPNSWLISGLIVVVLLSLQSKKEKKQMFTFTKQLSVTSKSWFMIINDDLLIDEWMMLISAETHGFVITWFYHYWLKQQLGCKVDDHLSKCCLNRIRIIYLLEEDSGVQCSKPKI